MAECEQLARAAVADAVVSLAAAGLWPHVKVDEIARAAGSTAAEVREAVARRRRQVARPTSPADLPAVPGQPRTRTPEGSPPSPEHVWCSRARHWVHHSAMARNKRRPQRQGDTTGITKGLSDWCLDCWDQYRRDRYGSRQRSG